MARDRRRRRERTDGSGERSRSRSCSPARSRRRTHSPGIDDGDARSGHAPAPPRLARPWHNGGGSSGSRVDGSGRGGSGRGDYVDRGGSGHGDGRRSGHGGGRGGGGDGGGSNSGGPLLADQRHRDDRYRPLGGTSRRWRSRSPSPGGAFDGPRREPPRRREPLREDGRYRSQAPPPPSGRRRDGERPQRPPGESLLALPDEGRRANWSPPATGDRGRVRSPPASTAPSLPPPRTGASSAETARPPASLPPHVTTATAAPPRRLEPISLAELAAHQRVVAAAEARPVFLSKAARQAAALERLAARRATAVAGASTAAAATTRPLAWAGAGGGPGCDVAEAGASVATSAGLTDAERTAIRRHYLRETDGERGDGGGGVDSSGATAARRRLAVGGGSAGGNGSGLAAAGGAGRPSDKARFRFEWDAREDTAAAEVDPMYAAAAAAAPRAALLYGRARPAGYLSDEEGGGGAVAGRPDTGVVGTVASRRARRSGGGRAPEDPRHWSAKAVDEMTERDWRIFREDHAIAVRAGGGKSAPRLARSWSETGLPDPILRLVRDVAKYTTPSPIQMAAIPIGLARRDMIGLAETGSGKTAAFVLPLLVHIAGCPPMTGSRAADGPYGLVLAPTRELAQQIEAEAMRFARPLGLRVTAVVGGLAIEAQGSALRAGAELVVATPGRLVDCLDRRYCVLAQCRYLVLDEADQMVDMGFEPQVRTILEAMPPDSRHSAGAVAVGAGAAPMEDVAAAVPTGGNAPRRGTATAALGGGGGEDDDVEPDAPSDSTRLTFMFSATLPPVVERLTRQFLYRPVTVAVGETGRSAAAVEQRVEYCTTDARKRQRLAELLRKLEPPIIVFANTKKSVDAVARAIDADTGIRTVVLHSGKAQEAREESLAAFKAGRVSVLIATDVLGRGIDIEGVAHVINYEIPQKIEQYTHRIGRTGRAGRTGVAWSFATAEDQDIFFELKTRLEASGAHVPPELSKGSARRAAAGGSAFGSAIID